MASDTADKANDRAPTALWGVVGWIGAGAIADPVRTLAAAASPGWRAAGDALTHVGSGAAISLSAATPGRSLAVDGNEAAAVFGYPQWSDPELETLARGRCAATALLEGFKRRGIDVLSAVHGPCGLVVLRPQRREALIAVDRLGIYPLYATRLAGDSFGFSTSACALAKLPGADVAVDAQAVLDFLFYYRVPAPRSIFTGQTKLLPAEYLHFENGRTERRFYWQMPFSAGNGLRRPALQAELLSRLEGAVRRAAGDEPHERLAAFLSGGLDSSTVCGFLSRISRQRLTAFTIGFHEAAFDETAFAQRVAEHFDLRLISRRIDETDVAAALPAIAQAYDEPFGNSSAVAVYFCAKLARDHGVDMMLAGDGGDEIFCGNKIYLEMKIFELYRRLPALLARRLITPILSRVASAHSRSVLGKARRYVTVAEIPMPDRMFRTEAAVLANARTILVDDLARSVDILEPLRIAREAYDRPPHAAFEQRMHNLDVQLVLADNDLRKVNRMCELAGVRVRFPMLDEDVVAFAAAIPPALLLENLTLRSFFKKAMRGFLPDSTITKRKHGFGLPFASFMAAGPRLRPLAQDALASLRGRGIIRAEYIDGLRDDLWSRGDPDAASTAWDLVMLELWLGAHADRLPVTVAPTAAVA